MRYEMDRTKPPWGGKGISGLLTRHPGIHRAMHTAAQRQLAIAKSRAPVYTGALRASGRVEDAGIQRVYRGESRMTVRVVFHSRYAMDAQDRTGFLTASLGRGPKRSGRGRGSGKKP